MGSVGVELVIRQASECIPERLEGMLENLHALSRARTAHELCRDSSDPEREPIHAHAELEDGHLSRPPPMRSALTFARHARTEALWQVLHHDRLSIGCVADRRVRFEPRLAATLAASAPGQRRTIGDRPGPTLTLTCAKATG
jgi:hypothetical protein